MSEQQFFSLEMIGVYAHIRLQVCSSFLDSYNNYIRQLVLP